MFYASIIITTEQKHKRFTKDKVEGIRAYHHGKSPIHKKRLQERKKGMIKQQNSQKATDNMALASPYISIITLNVSGLNYLIKSHRVAGWSKK